MIIAAANQKGGVGKTTTVVSLGAWFAQQGLETLIVDFDVQGHVATCLGLPKSNGLYRLLVDDEPVRAAAKAARDGLDVICSDKTTEKIKLFLSDVAYREYYIADHLAGAQFEYDVILLDLAPGSDILHIGALAAADWVIVPARMGLLEHDGVNEVLRTIASLGRIGQVDPPGLIGVLPTMYERVTTETQEATARLQAQIGVDAVLPPIPTDTHVREAIARGMTIWEYAPESPAAVGYANGRKVVNSRGRVGGYLHLGEIVRDMAGV